LGLRYAVKLGRTEGNQVSALCLPYFFITKATEHAPWQIIPADNQWFTRYAVAQIMADAFKAMNLSYPEMTPAHREALQRAKAALEAE